MTSYAFKPADIPLTAGKVAFYLVNPSNETHSMALQNLAVSIFVVALSANVAAGRSAVFTIDNLPVGVYRVTCPIFGPDGRTQHAAIGMVGTATVR